MIKILALLLFLLGCSDSGPSYALSANGYTDIKLTAEKRANSCMEGYTPTGFSATDKQGTKTQGTVCTKPFKNTIILWNKTKGK